MIWARLSRILSGISGQGGRIRLGDPQVAVASHILTEASDRITTEGGDLLVVE